ncbi:hypothetical protein [Aminivibrio sp.]|jgi:uncharacterized protein YwgA|uniref:hypothetical protein n=1 Tax=Aminivibrio sp. TaxID=1872489 RepID=UPI003D98AE42
MRWRDKAKFVASVVQAAGGCLTGRTKLQKTVYLIQAAGWKNDFSFHYLHYGPYSDTLAEAAENACLLNLLQEKRIKTSSGNLYSIYQFMPTTEQSIVFEDPIRCLIQKASQANAIELELAATALYLAKEEKNSAPWNETKRRKPQKSTKGFIDRAKFLYADLRNCAPDFLPEMTDV